MGSQARGDYDLESVIPFAPAAKNAASGGADQLDKAGQTILGLLHKAAGVVGANSQHALEMAQKLSHQLRAAENRIAELEAEVGMYQDKADRAEQWLHKVHTEIEDRFLRQEDGRRGAPQRRQGGRWSELDGPDLRPRNGLRKPLPARVKRFQNALQPRSHYTKEKTMAEQPSETMPLDVRQSFCDAVRLFDR